MSCVSPQGSKIEGTKMKSAPAYIYNKIQLVCYYGSEDVRGQWLSINRKISKTEYNFHKNKPNVRVAHHKSNKGAHGHHKKNVIDLPNLQNHFGSEDLELNQAIQPANQ